MEMSTLPGTIVSFVGQIIQYVGDFLGTIQGVLPLFEDQGLYILILAGVSGYVFNHYLTDDMSRIIGLIIVFVALFHLLLG